MALIKKLKVACYECRPFEIVNQRNGKTYKGYSVKAWDEKDQNIMFTSTNPVKENDLGSFDPALAFDVTLYGRSFQNEIKWSTEKPDRQPQGPSL